MSDQRQEGLTKEERALLLKLAREALKADLRGDKRPPLPDDLPDPLQAQVGAFVSLHQGKRLRGCIGTFLADQPLARTVQEMAVSAGTRDPRFSTVTSLELPTLTFELSVLSPLEEIQDVNVIEVGKHGIFITRRHFRGVLLPQVATEYGWTRETFLDQTCIKAGLSPGCWKDPDARIEIFSAEVFSDDDV